MYLFISVTVTRLIRISFGDYQLQTIPPGMVVEVPYKPISNQRRKGPLFSKQEQRGKLPGRQKSSKSMKPKLPDEELPSPVQWVRSYR